MTPEEIEASFSAAYDGQLDPETQAAFDAALAAQPELATRYAAFCRTLEALKQMSAGEAQVPSALDAAPTPDLLRGVQRRLRDRSGGRYYADRFSERSVRGGKRVFLPLILGAILLALLWVVIAVVIQDVQLQP
ncbi:MAG: hypothetical protein ABW321_34800 [Polyangiales bacterium]